MEASSSNSSNQNPRWKYHVFLSFRGEDCRNGFADHLYAALKKNGILTFRDDEELQRGEIISLQLVKAIKESLFAIVILSPNYPSSSWCLDELHEILESRRVDGRQAFPIFYGVDPSHVRRPKEGFAKAFEKHEQRYGEDSINVRKWRKALTEVANLSGWDFNNRGETKLIEQIVQELCKKLQLIFPSHNDELVGIDSRMEEMYSLLRLNEMNDVRFIGIWGMGGAGKTTLARIVYERFKNQFDESCFLHDVRDFSEKNGLLELQKKLLSNLEVQGMKIKDLYDGKKIIRNTLCNKRILLILDDVNANDQLENLVEDQKWFGKGSRVIVTTRNKQLMKAYGNLAFKIFKVELLNSDESLQLFFKRSFKGDQPKEEYLDLSKDVVHYAQGLPLALNVFGSFLCGRSIQEWEAALNMLKQKQDPQDDIFKILRLSYDGLDYIYKIIFLDIACFFNGWDRDHVTHILHICGHNPTIGIEVLIERSLLSYDGGHLRMHDLLQNMGKRIVFYESPNDPCRRSRLWSIKDVDHVLAKNKENEAIQGIVLNSSEPYKGHWNLEALSKLCNLKLLILRTSLHFCNSLNYHSNALRVLEWKRCPLESLQPRIQLNNLVDLKLHHSIIKQLWSEVEIFQELKFIDMSHSICLTQTPNVSGAPYLETMILKGCINLLKVHQSTGQHKKLVILSLEGCGNLKILPKKLEMNSLKNFILSGCSKVKKLPEFGDGMESLSVLDLKNCKSLLCLPNSIHYLKSLQILNISGCSKFSSIPNNLNEIETLEELDASGTAIRVVPSFIVHLKNLRKISFRGCKGSPSNSWDLTHPYRWLNKFFWRQQNPIGLMLPSISQMSLLEKLDLSHCNLVDESIFDNFGNLSSLRKLNLAGNDFVNLPTHSIASLSTLFELDVRDCARLQSLPILPRSLSNLFVHGCTSMSYVSFSQQLYDLYASLNPDSKGCASMSYVSYSRQLYELFGSVDLDLGPNPEGYIARFEGSFFYEMWNLLESQGQHSKKRVRRPYSTFLDIPGSEIPTWFDNQNYCCKDFLISAFPEFNGEFDSVVSIAVDIPNHCRSGRPWGIAVCLLVECPSSFDSLCQIVWYCKAPEDDYSSIVNSNIGFNARYLNSPCLLFDFLPSEGLGIKKNLIGDTNQLELVFCSVYRPYGIERKVKRGLEIRKCGYRLLWKDKEEMGSIALTEPNRIISDVEYLNKSTRLNEIAFDKSCQDDVTLSNPRPSKRGRLH